MTSRVTASIEQTRSREELIQSCILLVHHLARQYATPRSSVSLEDLIGEGYLGLVQAARKYDSRRSVRFSTYASTRVRGAMMDSLRRARPLSRPMETKISRLQAARRELAARLEREPTETELANRLRVSAAKLHEIERMAELQVTSLDCSLDGGSNEVPDGSESPEHLAVDAMFRRQLRRYVGRLEPRDREIILSVYWREQKLSEVAHRLGITQSRVSQLQARALSRLRSMIEEEDTLEAA
jgi:RNA polymerase sigma factor for flagellar operon FliA